MLAAVLLIGIIGGGFVFIQNLRNPQIHSASFTLPLKPKSGWCVIPGPSGFDPNAVHPKLNGIAALAAKDAWVVGVYDNAGLTEHWNGTNWRVVPTPDISSRGHSGLEGVAALSADNIWAVGSIVANYQPYDSYGGLHTLIEHWDGKSWSVVSENITDKFLTSLATANGKIWAIGTVYTGSQQVANPLIETTCAIKRRRSSHFVRK